MTYVEVLEELRKFSTKERLELIEDAIHLLQKDLQEIEQQIPNLERKRQLAEAAATLLQDYTEDAELTGFTALDGEDFHA
jgi:hypothetical protein